MTSLAQRASQRIKLSPGLLEKLAILAAVLLLIWGGRSLWDMRTNWVERSLVAAYLPPVPEVGEGWGPGFQRRLERTHEQALHGPDRIRALSVLSALYHINGYSEEAIDTYGAWLELEPRSAKAAYRLAVLLGNFGQAEESLQLFAQVLEEAPDYTPAIARKADVLIKSNRVEEAIDLLRSARIEFPRAIVLELRLAEAYMRNERWADADAVLSDLTRNNPQYGPAWSAWSTTLDRLGDEARLAESRRQAEVYRRRGQTPDPWMDELFVNSFDNYRLRVMASAYYPITREDRLFPVEVLRRAISLDPNDEQSMRQLAEVHLRLGQRNETRTLYERLLRLNPDEPQNWLNYVMFLEMEGEGEQARTVLNRGLQLHPESAELWFFVGNFSIKSQMWDQAIMALERANLLRPDFPTGIIELARAYGFRGDREKAIELAHRVLELHPGHALAITLIAAWWIEEGEEGKALDWIGRASAQSTVMDHYIEDLVERFEVAFGHYPATARFERMQEER